MKRALEAFEANPILAAVKDEAQLETALGTDCGIIFLLFGSLCSICSLVERVKAAGKMAFVHLDLTQGLAAKEVAADFVRDFAHADGIISTRPQLVRHARSIGLVTVLRVFLVDSISLDSLKKQIDACEPDLIEIMPGVMPKVVRRVCRTAGVPVITGGLISEKEDAMAALQAGALCISTTCEKLWLDA